MKMKDIGGHRSFAIEGNNEANPASVFVMGERGWTVELDKAVFISAIMLEFGLMSCEPVAPSVVAA